jgi:hypothetical protein
MFARETRIEWQFSSISRRIGGFNPGMLQKLLFRQNISNLACTVDNRRAKPAAFLAMPSSACLAGSMMSIVSSAPRRNFIGIVGNLQCRSSNSQIIASFSLIADCSGIQISDNFS